MTQNQVFDELISAELNNAKFDTWNEHGEYRFNALKKHKNSTIEIEYDGYIFLVQYKKAGGVAMGSYPDSFSVYVLHNFNKDNK